MRNSLVYIVSFCLVLNLPASAQNNSNSTMGNVVPYQIQVTDKATTVIAFPYTILDADCGIGELRAEKVLSMANVIKIKATIPNIDPTSLHVFTADHKFYVFQVTYHPAPITMAYDLRNRTTDSVKLANNIFPNGINEEELGAMIRKVRTEHNFLLRKKRKYHMKLTLGGIYVHDNILFLKFGIRNTSQLVYQADWMYIYMKDKNVAQRSSTQQLPIHPIYMDETPCIDGKLEDNWILAIPKTTIPNKKELIFEMQEKNGGRHISISIRNKDIFRAKRI